MTENMINTLKIIRENKEISNKLATIEGEESVYKFFKDLNPKITLEEFKEGLEELFSNHLEELQNENLLNVSGGEMKSKALNKTIAGVLAALSVGSALPSNISAYQQPSNRTSKTYNSKTRSIKSYLSNKKNLMYVGAAILAVIGIPTAIATVKHFTNENNSNNQSPNASGNKQPTPTNNNFTPIKNPTEQPLNDNENDDAQTPFTDTKSVHPTTSIITPQKSEFTGIQNIENSCYFNSALQLLFQIPEIRNGTFGSNLNNDPVWKKQSEEIQARITTCQDAKDTAEKDRNEFIKNFISQIHKEEDIIQAITNLNLQALEKIISELNTKKDALNNKGKFSDANQVSNEINLYKVLKHLIELFATNSTTDLKDEQKIEYVCSLFTIIGENKEKLDSLLNLIRANDNVKQKFLKLYNNALKEYNDLTSKYTDANAKLNEINPIKNSNESEEVKKQNNANLENLKNIMAKLSNKEMPINIITNIIEANKATGKQEDISRVIEAYFTGIPNNLVSIKHLDCSRHPQPIDANLLKNIPSKYKLIGINRYNHNGTKVLQTIDIPETIENVHGQKYELASVAIYEKGFFGGGHYYAYSKSSNGNWYKINDNEVSYIEKDETIETTMKENARLLLYRPVIN